MAHEHKLNQRIRTILEDYKNIKEQNMFGGLCFMHNGNMMCGADAKNGLMIRVGPEQYDNVMQLKYSRKMNFTGVTMKGLVFVNPQGYKTKAQLTRWLERGLEFTSSLPIKVKKNKKSKYTKLK